MCEYNSFLINIYIFIDDINVWKKTSSYIQMYTTQTRVTKK